MILVLLLAACQPLAVKYFDTHDSGVHPDSAHTGNADTDRPDDTDPGPDTDVPPDTGQVQERCTWSGEYTVEMADASFVGERSGDEAGQGLASPGDMDGDGTADLVIAAPANSELADEGGKVYFVHGRREGWTQGEPLSDYPSLVGENFWAQIARPGAMGDVNGDGLADVALTAGASSPSPDGRPFVFLGRTSTWPSSSPISTFVDGVANNLNDVDGLYNTAALTPFGDLDGDGLADWALKDDSLNSGEAYVVSGAAVGPDVQIPNDAMLWVYGGDAPIYVQHSGDFNGDGLADIVARNVDWSGFYLILGSTGMLPWGVSVAEAATTTIMAPDHFSNFENVGDVNGDGAEDMLLPTRDATVLFLGRDEWETDLTEDDADVVLAAGGCPGMVGRIGDINGDGLQDIGLLERTNCDADDAEFYGFFGRSTWPAALSLDEADVHIAPGPGLTDIFNLPDVDALGDLDGDGVDDLLLNNTYDAWNGVEQAGVVYLFLGRATWSTGLTTADADAHFVGTEKWQSMGYLFIVADMDGNGCDDVVAADPYYHPEGTEPQGEVFVFLGKP